MPDDDARTQLEAEVRARCEAEAWREAATMTLRAYGSEILGLLAAIAKDELLAEEAFAEFCEAVWISLPKFRWQASLRTWSYVLARHALSRVSKSEGRRRQRFARLGTRTAAEELADELFRSSFDAMRSTYETAAARLRRQLPEDDQTLLILRVDRRLEWLDIVEVLGTEDELGSEDGRRRAAARLRKRFQRVKVQLRQAAIAEGLIEG